MANSADHQLSRPTSSTNVHDAQGEWVRSIHSQCAPEGGQYVRRGAPAKELFFKVPAAQRKANPGAYDPFAFTFGPYHAKFDPQADMFKVQAVQALVVEEGAFQGLVWKIAEHHSEVTALYVEMGIERSSLERDTLACLLALDSVAIVAAVMGLWGALHIRQLIGLDALLLENQVPLFALRDAIESMKPGVQGIGVENLLQWYFECAGNPFNLGDQASFSSLPTDPDDPGWNKSLLAYIYDASTQRLKQSPDDESLPDYSTQLPTASYLIKYGIRFSASDTIHFDETTLTLTLPLIRVGDDTLRVFSNLLAYEATAKYPSSCTLISYVHFMDRLIDREEDVQLLIEAGVIKSLLGSHQELANKWNKLCSWVPICFTREDRQVMKDVIKVTEVKCRKWMATLKETYWERKPWLVISVVVATILLVLSFLQTFYTMKPYFT